MMTAVAVAVVVVTLLWTAYSTPACKNVSPAIYRDFPGGPPLAKLETVVEAVVGLCTSLTAVGSWALNKAGASAV